MLPSHLRRGMVCSQVRESMLAIVTIGCAVAPTRSSTQEVGPATETRATLDVAQDDSSFDWNFSVPGRDPRCELHCEPLKLWRVELVRGFPPRDVGRIHEAHVLFDFPPSFRAACIAFQRSLPHALSPAYSGCAIPEATHAWIHTCDRCVDLYNRAEVRHQIIASFLRRLLRHGRACWIREPERMPWEGVAENEVDLTVLDARAVCEVHGARMARVRIPIERGLRIIGPDPDPIPYETRARDIPNDVVAWDAGCMAGDAKFVWIQRCPECFAGTGRWCVAHGVDLPTRR